MHTIYTAGFTKESDLLVERARRDLPKLESRGVTEERLQEHLRRVLAMNDHRTTASQTHSQKEQLTDEEKQLREEVNRQTRHIQDGVKKTFPKGSPQWKEFHVGEEHHNSSATIAEWGDDFVSRYPKYQKELEAKGPIIQADIDALKASVALLRAKDKQQEFAVEADAPASTAEAKAARDAAIESAEFIYRAVKGAFINDPKTLKEYEQIREYRFRSSDGGEEKPPQNPPAQPPPPQPTT